MIQAIALDDDRSALTMLDAYCQRADGIMLCQVFTHPQQAQLYLQRNQVDLVFTETQVAGGSGIDFWHSVRRWATNKQMTLPGLVFTTMHSEYAVVSYELQALDYLLKPVSFERFSQVISKASDRTIARTPVLRPSAQQRCFRVDYGLVNVALTDIIYVEALGNYCRLYRADQPPLVIRSTLKSLLDELPPKAFMQIHRSYIVNTNHINAFRNKQIYLAGKQVPVGMHFERAVNTHFAGLAHLSQV